MKEDGAMFELRVEPEEKQLLPFYGMPVLLLMKDGSSKVGRLTTCRAGRIILNGAESDEAEAAVPRSKKARRRTRSRKPKELPAAVKPEVLDEADDFAFAPFGSGPTEVSAPPRESVPLQTVDSILIL
jgi:hypothetical protein